MNKKIILFFIVCTNALLLLGQVVRSSAESCIGGNCNPPKPITPNTITGDIASMIMQQAVDPNELNGPMGVDSVRWISKNDELSYTVFFENDPSFATAHAQIVDISIDMPDVRLLNDFKLGTYTFANRSYEIPNEPNFYSMRLDCRDSLDIYVDVLAGMDVENKIAYWRLSSIDPESGHAPWEVDRGLLPVNDSTHVGEGFVTFRIKPYEELVTGDTISFFANIVFDSNDTIPTNRWCNRIDAGAPISRVIANVDQENYSHYRLSFNAEDDKNGSGVEKVLLYLADNLGNYEEYASCPVDSILDFYVEKGKQYNFMSIAVDRVGNREEIKFEPDITLNFNVPPTDLLLSNTVFQDDIELDGFIGELSTIDTDGETEFTYALSEGEGAIHNDMFAVVGNRLQANDCFKCSDINRYNIRLSTTDAGGLTFSKAFQLDLRRVLEEPEPQIIDAEICEGEVYEFHGETYKHTGSYIARVSNDFMCDSIYTLNLRVNPIPEAPTITIKGKSTLVSSAEKGNQWYKDGIPIEGAENKEYTASETGRYSVTASNGRCESDMSDECFVNLDVSNNIMINLPRGWSWFSSNINDEGVKQPDAFFASAFPNIEYVRSSAGELDYDNGSLSGNISEIDPATYKVKVSSASQIKLNANMIYPDEYIVTLIPGWNWIPYIPSIELSLEVALSQLTPNENDIIKSHTQFSTYSDGIWKGSLRTLQPNVGYLYYSNSATSFKYSSSRAQVLSDAPASYSSNYLPWTADESIFADNKTIIAKLMKRDSETIEGTFAVAALCNDECRGIGVYIDGLLFITIYGNYGDHIKFMAYENATDNVWTISEEFGFDENPLGTVSEPYILNIDTEVGTDYILSGNYEFNIYPNPVRDTMFIDGDTSEVSCVKVIAISGESLLSSESFGHGINVSHLQDGVYVAAILTRNGVVYRKFLKKGY